MKLRGWTFVCEHNKDGVVMRSFNNINSTETEYTNTNKMMKQDVTHNILPLQLIFSMFAIHHIEMF